MSVVEKARIVAHTAHMAANHFRKLTNDPYIVHPADVADITMGFLTEIFHDRRQFAGIEPGHAYFQVTGKIDDMIAAAWLHDTIEDTGLDLRFIKDEFGANIHDLVDTLTDEKDEKLDRDERLEAYIQKLNAPLNLDAQVVKLADIKSNFQDIVKSHYNPDPNKKFKKYKRFITEKVKIIDSMTEMKKTKIAQDLKRDMLEFLLKMES